jgi:class 3 adenylate cyclase
MPTYMDIHEIPGGVNPEEVAKAHAADLEVQGKYGVQYHKYWINEAAGKIFCLCHAPSAEAANQVHREAHGLVAENIIEVEPSMAELFFGGTEVDPAGGVRIAGDSTNARDPGIRTILFTDIVGSTSITQSVGDEGAMALLDVHDTTVRSALADLGGREIKHTGDGIMAAFVSSAAAVKCATRVQRELRKHTQTSKHNHPVKVRIGVAAGEPVEHHSDLFGCTVQLAARLCSQAGPDQILVSNVVSELCLGKGLRFQDLGELTLKGFDHPVRAHAVDWADAGDGFAV